jgi:hypothetical protein
MIMADPSLVHQTFPDSLVSNNIVSSSYHGTPETNLSTLELEVHVAMAVHVQVHISDIVEARIALHGKEGT